MLFHAKEYPAYDAKRFPYNLGFCQIDSSLPYSARGVGWRNYLWYDGVLCALDLTGGSPLNWMLVLDGLQPFCTTDEAMFGRPLLDINYFDSLQLPPEQRLFCFLRALQPRVEGT